MKITVILCTFNRCKSLAKTLESVAASIVPEPVDWEVLVVDNNSKDQTREVVGDFCRRYPGRFRYVFAVQQGLSNARNAGIQGSRGEVIAFTDDDVIVEPLWLWNLTEPLQDGRWAGSGGRILLGQDFSPPPWLAISGPFDLGGSIVQFDQGDIPGELRQAPFGANMAYRKMVFEKYGTFRIDLGRCGDNLIGNEDTEFSERLMAGGERMWYAPSAVVYHPVQKERLTKKYFLAYWFDHGRSAARQAGKLLPVRSIPRHYLRLFRGMLRGMSASDPNWPLSLHGRFFCVTRACETAGEIVETYSLARSAKKPSECLPNTTSVSARLP